MWDSNDRHSVEHLPKNPTISDLKKAEQQYTDALRHLLSPQELYEFQLRHSRHSQKLRSLNFEWTEEEFREVLRYRLSEKEGNGDVVLFGDPSGLDSSLYASNFVEYSYSPQIETILGRDRYIKYLKAHDPAYQRLRTIASDNGSSNELELAYSSFVDFQHEVYELLSSGNVHEANRLKTQIRNEIATILEIKERSKKKYLDRAVSASLRGHQ